MLELIMKKYESKSRNQAIITQRNEARLSFD